MDKKEFKKFIKSDFKNISDAFFVQIEKYKSFLQEHNKNLNLTRLSDDKKIYGDYFYDSIIPFINIDFNQYKTILDIGSGSGIPGILLKLLHEELEITIVESNSKKARFMNLLVNELGLANVKIINKRAENIEKNEYEKFDIVTSRAVAPLKIILELSAPYCKVDGLIIEPKSKNWSEENKKSLVMCSQLNIKLIKIDNFISKNYHEHNVFIYKKIKNTNRTYPRKWQVIIKDNHD